MALAAAGIAFFPALAVGSFLNVVAARVPLERSIANFWMVPHTTFYAEPARLTRGGFLSEEQEPSGRRRKLYSLPPPSWHRAGRDVPQTQWGNEMGR